MHAYGDPHKIEFLTFLVAAVQSVRPDFDGPPMDPPPLEFQLADPDKLRRNARRPTSVCSRSTRHTIDNRRTYFVTSWHSKSALHSAL